MPTLLNLQNPLRYTTA